MFSLTFAQTEAAARLDQQRCELKQGLDGVLKHLMHDSNMLANRRDIDADDTFMVIQRLQAHLLQYARARGVQTTISRIDEREEV